MTAKSVDLFTKEEHVIIADWLGVEPKCDVPNIRLYSFVKRCGMTNRLKTPR